jgi:ketosteroid isomerase-like protein
MAGSTRVLVQRFRRALCSSVLVAAPLLLLLACGSGERTSAASASTEQMVESGAADVEQVIAAERALWEAWRQRDLQTIERLTAEDYYTVDEDGPAGAWGLSDIRDNFDRFALEQYRLGDIEARIISPDVIVLVYNAYISGRYDGEDISRGVAEASVWTKRDGRWLNVLLHEVSRARRDEAVDP